MVNPPVKPGPCRCDGVSVQEYQGQIGLARPAHFPINPERPVIAVDACLAMEVTWLWGRGIVTTGCCCGHGVRPPFVGVLPVHIPEMKAMGYVVQDNPCRPGDEDSFWPKSITPTSGAREPISDHPLTDVPS